MTLPDEKKIIIIAGPNGAGKTTFANEFLPNEAACPVFINADLIAAGLAPFQPETAAFKAGRIMLEGIHEQVRKGQSFAFETTLSGRTYAGFIPGWQRLDYTVKLLFLQLDSPELAIARVKQRVKEGGHHIPEPVIRRRFKAGLDNLENLYKPLVDEWAVYDNTGLTPQTDCRGNKIMTDPSRSSQPTASRDPDLVNAEIALKRAALHAREQAKIKGTAIVISENGVITKILPESIQDE